MQEFLLQIILAGRGEDSEGWMNILFIVVLAVFWVISGIIKATAKKPQDGQQQPPSRKPARRIPISTKAREPSSHSPVIPVQAARSTKIIAGLEKAFRSKIMEAIPKLESSLPKPYVEPVLQENHPELTSKPLIEPEHNRLGIPQRTPEAEELPEFVLDYTDPDELSKAIVQYEIFGPPVSLRNPSDQI